MPKKFECKLSADYLKKSYIDESRTLEEMCDIIGVKSPITARKVLNNMGISTNRNARLADNTKHGMSDEEFKTFLTSEYENGKSMQVIGNEIGISPAGIRKYFLKYNIPRRGRTEHWEVDPLLNPNWKGGKILHDGYIITYCPNHPKAQKNKYVYEHILVMEKYIGRYLKEGEVVHHIDGNKSNNDINNLLLMTNSDHVKLHALLRKSKKRMEEQNEKSRIIYESLDHNSGK